MLDFDSRVEEIMIKDVYTLTPEDKVLDATKMMLDKHIRCVPIITKDGAIEGIVTDSDIAFQATGKTNILDMPLSEVMSRNPIWVKPDTDIYHVVKLMGDHGFRRVPVVEDNKIVGLVSVRDVVRQILQNLETIQ